MSTTKLYCFVDETGQDTQGNPFLVTVVLKEINGPPFLEKRFEEIEAQKPGCLGLATQHCQEAGCLYP